MNEATFLENLSDLYNIDDSSVEHLDKIIDRAVKKISEFYPYPEFSHVETVINQTRYTINNDDIIKITEVHYRQVLSSNPFNDSDVPNLINPSGSNNLSRQLSDQMELEINNKFNPTGARIVSSNIFDLIPTPECVESVYYEYDRYRTISEIPVLLEEEMFALVFYFKNDSSYQTSRSENNGNVFNFNRRGNATESDMSSGDFNDLRSDELKSIEGNIKKKVIKLG